MKTGGYMIPLFNNTFEQYWRAVEICLRTVQILRVARPELLAHSRI